MNTLTDKEYESRKKLFEEIKRFNRTEQEELFRILVRCKEDVSENKNGIFFDITNLNKETIQQIQEYVVFCSKNRMQFEMREKEISDLQQQNPGITTE